MVFSTQPRTLYVVVYIAGFIMPYLTGFLGLMPLDQSVVFTAGGRIATGEMPFTDFYLPYGLVPSVMQAAFFKVMGVSWFTYVTQAAVINGFFAVFIFDCLRMLIPFVRPVKLVAGTLLCAWAFYPVTGTPFLENHSMFFSLIGYWCCLNAFCRRKFYLLAFSFPLLVPGFYSKPIPAVFWVLPILLECWWNRSQWKHYRAYLFVGALTSVALLVLPFFIFPSHDFYYNAFLLPVKLGKGRLQVGFAGRFMEQFKYFKIFFLSLIPMILYLAYEKNHVGKFRQLGRSTVLIGFTILFGVLTKGNFYNITTPVFLFCALIFHFLLIGLPGSAKLPAIYRRFNFLFWMILLVAISVLNFRRTKDISFAVKDLKNYSGDLGIFIKTPLDRYKKTDIEKLKAVIQRGRVFYTGDLQFLFPLTGQYNPLPFTHINDGTTYSSRDPVGYAQIKQQLLENMITARTNIFVEDESIYNRNQALVAYLQPLKDKLVDSFGVIKVYTINDAALAQLANNLKSSREK